MNTSSDFRRTWVIALAGGLFGPSAYAAIGLNHGFLPSTVVAGQSSTVTLNLLNQNSNPATGTGVTIPLNGLTVTNPSTTCGGTATVVGTGLVLTGGTVPAGPGGTCTVTASVTSSAAGTFPSAIPIGAVTSSEGTNTEASSIALQVNALAPIAGTKAFAPTTVRGGGKSTVTITLNNPNSEALTNAALTDSLPPDIVVAPTPNAATTCGAATVTAVAGNSSVSVVGGTIPAHSSCTVTFDVTATNPNTTRNVNRTNTIAQGGVTAANGASNLAPFSAGVTVQTGARIIKDFIEDPVGHGQSATLRLRIENWNATALTNNITFTDTLPADLTPTNVTTTCSSGTPGINAPRTVSFTGGSLAAAGATATYCDVMVTYTADNTTGAYYTRTNDATNFNPGLAFGTVVPQVIGDSVNVNPGGPGGGVSASKTFNGTQWLNATAQNVQTSTISMVITLSNSASSAADIVSFTDDLSVMGQSFAVSDVGVASTTCGGTVNASVGATAVTKTDGTIPANGSCTITVPVKIGGNATIGWHRNAIGPGANRLVTSLGTWNGINFASTYVNPSLTASKTFNPTTFSSGQTTSQMTITLTRAQGATSLTNLSFNDPFPTGVPFALQAQSVVSNSCAGSVDLSSGVRLTGGALVAPNDASANSCSVVVQVGAAAGASGTWTNTLPVGSITSAEGVSNNNATSAAVTASSASIGLSKSFRPTTLTTLGQTSTLSLVISNTEGAPTQSGVKLTDNLPFGMAVASPANASMAGTGCVVAPADIVAAPGGNKVELGGAGATVPAGATCTITLDVVANAVGNLTNVLPAGSLTSNSGLRNTGVAQATLTMVGSGDVGVTITNNANGVVAGGTTIYVVTVTNNGTTDVAGANLTNNAPIGITYGSWTCAATGTATCPSASGSGNLAEIVSLPVGAGLTYTINAAVASTITGPVTNTANISVPGAVNDTNPANNSAFDTDPSYPAGTVLGSGVAAVPVSSAEGLAMLTFMMIVTAWLGRRRRR